MLLTSKSGFGGSAFLEDIIPFWYSWIKGFSERKIRIREKSYSEFITHIVIVAIRQPDPTLAIWLSYIIYLVWGSHTIKISILYLWISSRYFYPNNYYSLSFKSVNKRQRLSGLRLIIGFPRQGKKLPGLLISEKRIHRNLKLVIEKDRRIKVRRGVCVI